MKIKLLKFKSVKSTNNTAMRLIKSKYSKPTIVSSLKQTNGRGTMGKKWISKKFKRKIQIKWPNDLLISKKKFCGILQETVTYGKKKFLIVGMGINTNFDPNIKSFSSTCLKYIINRNIDNNKLLYIIKKKYENFLIKTEKCSHLELIKYTNKA